MLMKKHIPSLVSRLFLALTVLTRLPMPALAARSESVAESMSMFPLAGILVGTLAGGVFWVLFHLLTPWPAAIMAVAVSLVVTGALHEDGLADLADGLGARGDKTARLSVMRDPHVGTFGALALILSVLVRTALLASAPDGVAGLTALITAAAVP